MLSGRTCRFRRITHGTVSGWGVSMEASCLVVVVDGRGWGLEMRMAVSQAYSPQDQSLHHNRPPYQLLDLSDSHFSSL